MCAEGQEFEPEGGPFEVVLITSRREFVVHDFETALAIARMARFFGHSPMRIEVAGKLALDDSDIDTEIGPICPPRGTYEEDFARATAAHEKFTKHAEDRSRAAYEAAVNRPKPAGSGG